MRRIWGVFLTMALLLSGCDAAPPQPSGSGEALGGLVQTGSLELRYARQFSVDYYEGGYALLSLADDSRYLVVPPTAESPAGLGEDVVILRQGLSNLYLAASSVMCLFDALDSLGNIRLSGTVAEGWHIENARAAMERGDILYAGKYNEPDYEQITAEGCTLAVESTMISHTPEVREKLEELGVPVLMDQSSYESNPLGRAEWIKLYGVLLGKEDEAKRIFDAQEAYVQEASAEAPSGKTVAFFYISSSNYAVVRKSSDYVANMIQLAGGQYVFDRLGDPEKATSTVTMELEQFYAGAKDADVLIYNSTVDGEIASLDALLQKSPLLSDFKAVQTGDVWCTTQNLYQEMIHTGEMVSDFQKVLSGAAGPKLHFLYRLT